MDSINRASATPNAAMPVSMGATPNPNASPAAVGRQFESIFTSLLIKQMRQGLDSETMFGKDAGDILGGMFDQFLGDHLAKSGSLGIGQMIRSQLERRAPRT
jgi:Rod binding domain-containing protein